jgi:nicotinate phosphoribosyltransferase
MKFEDILRPVIQKGKIVSPLLPIREIAGFSKQRLSKLQREFKRVDNPHIYKVGISTKLMESRDVLMKLYKP